MIDLYGRMIDYMRVSITDRCNLRCVYCQPNGIERLAHADILSYEEILRVCEAAAALGVDKFKITGGDPLVRKGCTEFAVRLKSMHGARQVTVTTNGLLLGDYISELSALDGVNISLNAVDADIYRHITGVDGVATAIEAVKSCANIVKTKINCVLLSDNVSQIISLVNLACDMAVDVRFIELMPLGYTDTPGGMSCESAYELIRSAIPDLERCTETRGNGPAVYYKSERLRGRIGFIAACSNKFCASCNRIRLTATGFLKPCLCYNDGIDLRRLLRGGAGDEEIKSAIRDAVLSKPAAHCFDRRENITERRHMNEIGG